MHFNQFQKKATETAVYDTAYTMIYSALGLAGEAGEVANKAKKVIRDHNGHISQEAREAIAKELGDVLWYVAALATDLGLSLDDIAKNNLKKLQKRKQKGTIQGDGDER